MSTGQLILITILALSFIAAYPFAKAGLLYGAMAALKFQARSYRKAMFCVLIGIGAILTVEMILIGVAMRTSTSFDPAAVQIRGLLSVLLGSFLTPVSEAIALHFYFKESPGKTLGAIALHYLFFTLAAIALTLLSVVVAFVVKLVTG